MSTLTKKDFVETVATRLKADRDLVRDVLQEFLDQLIEKLGDGQRVEFRDFGVFEVRQRAARVAQNPKTMQRVEVPARKTVKFKPGRLMKDRLTVKTDSPSSGSAAPDAPQQRPSGSGGSPFSHDGQHRRSA